MGLAAAQLQVPVDLGAASPPAQSCTVVVWRGQAEHAAKSVIRGSRVVVVGRLQQRSWTAEDGSVRKVVEVVAEGLGPKPSLGDRPTRAGHQQ